MSIAVSALLKTPLPIIAAVRIVSSGFLFLAVVVWFGFGIEIELPQKILTITVCLIAGFSGLFSSRKLVDSFYINISREGDVTFAIASSQLISTEVVTAADPAKAKLLPGTTIWPHFIVLRLSLANGHIVFIPVMKRLVEEHTFRSLSVACKWILRHNDPAQGTKS